MRTAYRRGACIVCCVVMLVSSLYSTTAYAMTDGSKGAYEISEPYVYDISPGSAEWSTLYEPEQKLAACSVPLSLVQRMTTKALVETVIKYPLLIDIYAYGSLREGIEVVSSYFCGLEELFSRHDATMHLEEYREQVMNEVGTTDIEYFYADSLLSYLTEEEPEYMVAVEAASANEIYIATPNGTPVEVLYNLTYVDHDNVSQSYINAKMEEYLETYPSTVLLSGADPAYNCHSYAWFRQSTSNDYWMNDPSAYMEDGSYTRGAATVGCKVFYNNSYDSLDHSAVLITAATGSTPAVVKSKWGYYGLFSHYINDCPYANPTYGSVSISYWS